MGLLERIVAMLTKLGQRGYAVHDAPAEYATWLDSDPDTATDGEHEQMDRLLSRQKGIEKALAAKHLKEGRLVLYDITSSYFEGEYTETAILNLAATTAHCPPIVPINGYFQAK